MELAGVEVFTLAGRQLSHPECLVLTSPHDQVRDLPSPSLLREPEGQAQYVLRVDSDDPYVEYELVADRIEGAGALQRKARNLIR